MQFVPNQAVRWREQYAKSVACAKKLLQQACLTGTGGLEIDRVVFI
jgi:hypothetical protein